MKNIRIILRKFSFFVVVKFSVNLNRLVSVMKPVGLLLRSSLYYTQTPTVSMNSCMYIICLRADQELLGC